MNQFDGTKAQGEKKMEIMDIKNLLTLDLIDKNVLSHLSGLLEVTGDQKFEIARVNEEASPSQRESGDLLVQMFDEYHDTFNSLHNLFVSDYEIKVNVVASHLASEQTVNSFGISLLQTKTIDRPLINSTIIHSISVRYWEKLSKAILSNNSFTPVISNLTTLYNKEIDKKVDAEIKKVPFSVDQALIKKYRKQYHLTPLSFEDFLDMSKISKMGVSESDISHQSSASKREIARKNYEAALEKKKNEDLQEKQSKSYDNYDSYFKMDERQIKQAKRHGKMSKRKYSKKTRRRPTKK